MAESDEEPDYMSDDFLAKCLPKDVRPSLVYNPGMKRKHELEKKQKEANTSNKDRWKSHKVLEQEAREAGLKKQIGSENKGFQLLAKMGYKPGTSIGRNLHNEGQALKEPISVEVKGDRMGLGKKTVEKEKLIKFREKRIELEKLTDPLEFRKRKQAAAALKDIEWDLRKAQSACQTLDQGSGVCAPKELWYWPKLEKLKKLVDDKPCLSDSDDSDSDEEKPAKTARVVDLSSDEEEEAVGPSPQEQLTEIILYLRETYFYCIWCGTNYDNAEDLIQSCPGNSREDH